jgi:hypothetical protein
MSSTPEKFVECANPMELMNTPKEDSLKFGDLVVVDYAEKKKMYKWPAIVFLLFGLLMKIVPPGHMTDNMLDYPPENDEDAIGVRWIEPLPSYSWVKKDSVRRLTADMIEDYISVVQGPKKLIQAWEMARNPPSVWEYMLEKKVYYHQLVEKYKAL